MAEVIDTAETCAGEEADCADEEIEPERRHANAAAGTNDIDSDTSDPDRLASATIDQRNDDEISRNSLAQTRPGYHSIPVQGPQRHAPQHLASMPHWMSGGRGFGMPLLLVLFLVGSLVWHYYRHRKRQREWQLSSKNQLEQIRLRNSQAYPADVKVLAPKTEDSPDGKKIEKDVDLNRGKVGLNAMQEQCLINSGPDMKTASETDGLQRAVTLDENEKGEGKYTSIEKVESDTQQRYLNVESACPQKIDPNQSNDDNIKTPMNEASRASSSERLSKIRAKQQEQLERNTKSAQQERHQQQKKKKQILHNSLDHVAADEAYERRKNVIAEEQLLLVQSHGAPVAQHREQEQDTRNEFEEIERVAILHEQNLEYQESLQRDQERAREIALENEMISRREKAIEEANQRLVSAGVQNDAITQSQDTSNSIDNDKSEVKVRLLLPSGQRIEGIFAAHHTIGLVYDLALIVLDREQLLGSQEDNSQVRELQNDDTIIDDDDSGDSASSAAIEYSDFRIEWNQIFFSFSLASTYPQKTFDNLSITLEEGGLSQNAMLMVVVESD